MDKFYLIAGSLFAAGIAKRLGVFGGGSSGARVWPVPHRGIISGFGVSRPDADGNAGVRRHAAIDIGAVPGDPILAISDGVVLYPVSGYRIGTDLQAVAIRHADADYIYAEIHVGVKPGQTVSAGQQIGTAAVNGDGHSMLHLEAWRTGMAPHGFTPWWSDKAPPAGLLNVQEMMKGVGP